MLLWFYGLLNTWCLQFVERTHPDIMATLPSVGSWGAWVFLHFVCLWFLALVSRSVFLGENLALGAAKVHFLNMCLIAVPFPFHLPFYLAFYVVVSAWPILFICFLMAAGIRLRKSNLSGLDMCLIQTNNFAPKLPFSIAFFNSYWELSDWNNKGLTINCHLSGTARREGRITMIFPFCFGIKSSHIGYLSYE